MRVKSESEVTKSCPTLATPWTAAYQAPPSMGFSRQKYWSGVPLPSPCFSLGGSNRIEKANTGAQLVKNPPAIQETPVGFLGWEDPLEKG